MAARVLLLDNTLHPRLFILAKRWLSHMPGTEVDVVHALSARELPAVGGYTHLVLTGSEASILKPTPWMDREAEVVRAAAADGVRVLGSCFGHQMLVSALSGAHCLGRSARPEVGWTRLEILADDDLLRGLPNPWTVFSFHFDEVVAAPRPWRVLARSRDCATEILRYGDAPIWGIQAHPEISRRTAEFVTRGVLLATRRRGGLPRATFRRAPTDAQAFFGLVRRSLGDEIGRSG